MRSIRLIAVLGILAAASVVPSTHGPPTAPPEVRDLDRLSSYPVHVPTLAVNQQDLELRVARMFGTSPAPVASTEQWASQVALAERSEGALDLFDSGSSLALTTTYRGVDTSKRPRIALGDSGRTPLRI